MTPVEAIKQKLDLVEYIKQHVQLTKSGANWKGLCPFHQDKVPSFFVSPAKQFWYCFGCHKGGDLFRFVMESERMEFPDALKLLAEKAGVELRREDPQLRSRRNKLLEVLADATEFFQKNLAQDSKPYEYLRQRGLRDTTIHDFRLGFAPDSWRSLYEYLSAKKLTPEEMEGAGIIVRQHTSADASQSSGYYDRFRSRIMFPIFDVHARVIGFSGRIFAQAEEAGGKYINTPETMLFEKSKTLYGIEHAKDYIRKENVAVLVEGQMDFLLSWQDGVKNIVASSGTALTDDQLSMLKRQCDTVILAFDMDVAGEEATDRSITAAHRYGFSVKIATLPTGKDAAEFVRVFPGKLQEILKNATPAMEYFFEKAFSRSGTATLEEKRVILHYLLPRIKSLASPVDQSHWIEQLARKIKVDDHILYEELRRTPSLDEETSREYTTAPGSDTTVALLPEKTRLDILAERALSLVLKVPEEVNLLGPYVEYFPLRLLEFVRALVAHRGKELDPALSPTYISQESLNYLSLRGDYELALLDEQAPPQTLDEELELTLRELKREKIRTALREVSLAIQEAEFAKNDERLKTLMYEFNQLSNQLINEEI